MSASHERPTNGTPVVMFDHHREVLLSAVVAGLTFGSPSIRGLKSTDLDPSHEQRRLGDAPRASCDSVTSQR
jgi:hypothetical protein